jgi:3-hydroxyisobutyrate dehydrogenase
MHHYERVGVVGLGTMGAGMAGRLLDLGVDLVVHNRTAARAAPLAERGAVVVDSPAEVAARTDTVLVSLADQTAVEQVLFGPDGVVAALPPGGTVVDTSTVAPAFARSVAARAAAAGRSTVDACVLGNARHAREGELRFLVGANPAAMRRVEPLLAGLGKDITHFGGHGQGAAAKLVLNMLMGVEMQALGEVLLLGQAAGLPRDALVRLVAASGFSSPVMRFKCQVMGRRAFRPADFRLALMRKDMTLALAEAERLAVPLPAAAAAGEVLDEAVAAGLGELDCAAVLAHLEGVAAAGPARPAAEPA